MVQINVRRQAVSAKKLSFFLVAGVLAPVLILLLVQPLALSPFQVENPPQTPSPSYVPSPEQDEAHGQEEALSVSASVHGEEHEASHRGGSGFWAKVLNFAVLFGGLFLLLRKPVGRMLGQRADDIRSSMAEAEESHRNAEEKLVLGRNKLDAIAEEVKTLDEEAREAGRKEKEAILASARKEVERLKKLGTEEIALLTHAGMKELKTFAAEKATSLARENIKKRITAADQVVVIDRAIERLDVLTERMKNQ